jgi:hypothetical protein
MPSWVGVKPRGIHWTNVVGMVEASTTGSICVDEITQIIRELVVFAKSGYRVIIGAVPPFRRQMTRMRDALESDNLLPRHFLERIHFLTATAQSIGSDALFRINEGQCYSAGKRYAGI